MKETKIEIEKENNHKEIHLKNKIIKENLHYLNAKQAWKTTYLIKGKKIKNLFKCLKKILLTNFKMNSNNKIQIN
jgi:hypothetical protein